MAPHPGVLLAVVVLSTRRGCGLLLDARRAPLLVAVQDRDARDHVRPPAPDRQRGLPVGVRYADAARGRRGGHLLQVVVRREGHDRGALAARRASVRLFFMLTAVELRATAFIGGGTWRWRDRVFFKS